MDQTIAMLGYANTGIWIDHNVGGFLVQQALTGVYQLDARYVRVNDGSAKPLASELPTLLSRLVVPNVKNVLLTSGNKSLGSAVEAPSLELTLSSNRRISSHFALLLSVEKEINSSQATREYIRLFQHILVDSRSQYACANEINTWGQITSDRNNHLLMKRSNARGAYWLTYFGPEYVIRMGGFETLKAAPAYSVEQMTNGGILLQAYEYPLMAATQEAINAVSKLHRYLLNLVCDEERV